MIRITDSRPVIQDEVMYVEYAGESTDTKPVKFGQIMEIEGGERVYKDVQLATGSVFVEVDKGDVYLFSEKTNTWKKVGG